MGTYKVLQDIEAEDKLLGPLTLRQFIYAIIVIVSGLIAFKLGTVAWWLVLPFLPHMIFFAVLAAPFGHDQPNEVWLLAKIRFFLKPRLRIWDQSGVKQLVTVTVPKIVEHHLTNDLSQDEVKSRLQALANTIDSRGWAVKNVNVNLFAQPAYAYSQASSDRLIDPASLPNEVPNYDVNPNDDILDENSSPTAQHLTQLIAASEQSRRQNLTQLASPAPTTSTPPVPHWFANSSNVPDPGPLPQLPKAPDYPNSGGYTHMKVVQPLSNQPSSSVTPQSDPAILGLANNDDLNVATIARQANKSRTLPPDDEVVIPLR